MDPHIFADPDPGRQNLADPTDPDTILSTGGNLPKTLAGGKEPKNNSSRWEGTYQ